MKQVLLLCWVFLISSCKSQILPENVHRMLVPDTQIGAEYLIFGDTSLKKPLLIYCTGSLAVPLFEEEDGKQYSTLPFNYKDYWGECHILVISKIGVPILASVTELDAAHAYIDSETKLPPEKFTRNNTTEVYASACHNVLDKLKDKKWIDPKHVLVAGHSAGARLATKIAAGEPLITHLAYLSAEPQGRMYEMLQQEPRRSQDQSASIEEWLNFWKETVAKKEENTLPKGDSYTTWYSNSEDILDDLLAMEIPILAAMGTADPKSTGMLVIPYEFIRRGKENLTFLAYEDLEHSYFELKPDGKINYDDYHFSTVFKDVIDWWLHNKSEFDTHLSD